MSSKQTANRTVHLSELTGHIKSVGAITWSNQQSSTFHRNVADSFLNVVNRINLFWG